MNKLSTLVLICSVAFWLTGCVGIGGEDISLTHDPLTLTEQQFSNTLAMQQPANDLREEQDRIGRATVTLFAISSGSIKTTSDLKQQVSEQVKQALESIGYQINLVDEQKLSTDNSATVKIEIKEFWFKNYNWIWPFVPTWGDIELRLLVEGQNNEIVFDKSFKGEGNSYCLTGECAFNTAITEAVTDVLNQIIEEGSKEVFRNAITVDEIIPDNDILIPSGSL